METILAFVLTVTVGGQVHDMGEGLAAFRDIYRCEQFATAIERNGNTVFAGNQNYYYDKIVEARCLPQFVPEKTKFWD